MIQQKNNFTAAPRVAIVTGAGRGLGRYLAAQLIEQGLQVAGLARTASDLDSLAAESRKGTFLPVPVDVSDTEALRAAFTRIDVELGPPDILINNAAVYPHRCILDETPESFREVVEINLGGTLTCLMLALERMVPRGIGKIVNVGTFAGDQPAPGAAAYSVSKGAARILTRAVARDLKERYPDIVVTDWMPGVLDTDMGLPHGLSPQEAARWGVALALQSDRSFNGATFVLDREHLPPMALKRRLLNKLTGRDRAPRQLETVT